MDLPRYFIIGNLPVKFAETADGGMDVLVYKWDTRDFERDLSYLAAALFDEECDEVSEREFDEHVAELRQCRKHRTE